MIPLVRYKENEFLCICIVVFQIRRVVLGTVQTKKPARRPVEEEIKRAENKKHYQKANW